MNFKSIFAIFVAVFVFASLVAVSAASEVNVKNGVGLSFREMDVPGVGVRGGADVDARVAVNSGLRQALARDLERARGNLRDTMMRLNVTRHDLNASIRNFSDAWRDLKAAKRESTERRNARLLTAIDAFVTAHIEIALRLEEKGANATSVAAFVEFATSQNASAQNASFEQRKEIFRQLHARWQEFKRQVQTDLIHGRILQANEKLNATIARANQVIANMSSRNVSQTVLETLNNQSATAQLAVESVVQTTNLREAFRNLLHAKREVRILVKMVIRAQNGLSTDVEVEAGSEVEVAQIPDVEIAAAAST